MATASDKFQMNTGDSTNITQFKTRAFKIVELAKQIDMDLVAFYSPELPVFRNLGKQKQLDVLSNMDLFINICAATISSGEKVSNNKAIVWSALKQLGLRFQSDMFDLISDEDVIEVYTADNIQVFRNFKAMGMLSYSLEELFCTPWPELFSRDDDTVMQKTFMLVGEMMQNPSRQPISVSHLGYHMVKEVNSPLKYQYDYLIKSIAPLFDEHWNKVGFVAIEDIKISSPTLSPEEQASLIEKHWQQKVEPPTSTPSYLRVVQPEL